MPSLLINKQRVKKKQKFTRFSQLTEKKSSALNSVKMHHMKSSSTSRTTTNIILLKSMERVFVTRKIIVQTKSQYKRDGFPSRDRPVSACHMGWWLRLSQPSPRLVIMTPLSRYKTMWSSLQSWRTFFFAKTVPFPRRRAFCPLPSGALNGLKSHSAFFGTDPRKWELNKNTSKLDLIQYYQMLMEVYFYGKKTCGLFCRYKE